jgi:SAV_6107-like HEPN
VLAGRGAGKRFARPADHPIALLASLADADFGASPGGVMTMISTLTAAGAPTRNAMPLPSRVPAAALSLLRTARLGLSEAEAEADAGTRYIGAHLAALRAAAAIVAARGEPGTGARRRRPRSVWDLLPQVEPALAEWAAFFAASAAKRAAAEAGLPRAASAREADDLLRDAATFLSVAERALGLDSEPMLPLSLRHAS